VGWTDGPRTARVDAIVQRYAGATFDGMQDLTSHHDIEVNGVGRRTLCDFIFCERRVSDEDRKRQVAGQLIRQRCTILPGRVPSADYFGNHAVDDLAAAMARDMEYDQLTAAFRRVVLQDEDAD
jgi:hypothetical protein